MPNLSYDVFHFIIPNSSNTHILVSKSTGTGHTTTKYRFPNVSSPRFTCEEDLDDPEYEEAIKIGSWNGHTEFLAYSARENLDLVLYIRDIVWHRRDVSEGKDNGREESVLVADLRADTVLQSSLCWVSLEQINELSLVSIDSDVETSVLINGAFEARSSFSADLSKFSQGSNYKQSQPSRESGRQLAYTKPPWRKQGWITEIERWFTSAMQLQSLRIPQGYRINQKRNMHYSTVLNCQVESTGDSASSDQAFDVYLKSTYSGFSEALITKAVASHFPDLVPTVLAIRDDNTFVQRGACSERNVPEREIMRALANLQIRSVDSIESLKNDGVPYRGLDWHAQKITNVLQHPALTPLQGEKFYNSLKDHINDFQTLLTELASYDVPQTLVHGDFNLDNIHADISEDDSPRFIDWSDACIGYPFIDFCRISEIEFDGIREKSATDTYLNVWKRYESDDNIARALELTYPLVLCDNLDSMLKQYEAANEIERPHIFKHLENRVEGFWRSLDRCIRDRNSNSDVSEGTNVIIIAKEGGNRVLAQKRDDTLSLPEVTAFGIARITDLVLDGHGISQVVRAQLGIDTRPVRELWIREATRHGGKVCIILETVEEEHEMGEGYTWMREKDMGAFNKYATKDRFALETFFRENRNRMCTRTPWREFGWLKHTREWLDISFERKGLEIIGGLHEMKTNGFCTVWKCYVREVGKDQGQCDSVQSVFVKSSVVEIWEGKLLSVMSKFAEGLVPAVIEKDRDSNMFVMTDVGRVMEDDIDLSLALKGLGRVQKSSIGYIDELRETGLPEYSCDWVKQNTKRVLEESRLTIQDEDGIGTASQEIDADAVIRCVDELEALGMPVTLVHGDFHKGNVGSTAEDGHKMLDWGSAFIGHPLSDVAVMIRTSGDGRDEKGTVEGYLPMWKGSITEASFSRSIDQAFVYYWIVNLESLLQDMEKVYVQDQWLVKDRIVSSLRVLSAALDQVEKRNAEH